MFPTLLITLREVIEATLIVATILGILVREHRENDCKTVWTATIAALILSFFLVLGGSLVGVNVSRVFGGPLFEGGVYVVSAFFVTWAVFFLHSRFAQKKMLLLSRMRETLARDGIFALTFIAVLREGIEITLFLTTIYLTSTPVAIVSGFFGGIALGLSISFLFFRAIVRVPVYWAFRATGFLLIFSAGGLLAQGVGDLLETGPFPNLTGSIHTLPLIAATTYIYLMHRRVFVRSR